MKKIKIKETIVVEGKSDASNLANVCDANYIITSGLHISKKTYSEIERAIKTTGIIIFTDPDSAGKSIRSKIVDKFSNYEEQIKHAYISIKEGKKNNDVGVENAKADVLIKALTNVWNINENKNIKQIKYTMEDMLLLELTGSSNAKKNREILCENLRIGYSNAKSLCKKLNSYQIPKDKIIELQK